jgi:hypothetical protein
MREILWVIATAATAIVVVVNWKGEAIYAVEEAAAFMERVEKGEGLKWE